MRGDGPAGIVVVDDAVDLRMLICRVLKTDGRLEVLAEAGNGQLGIEAVRRHGPRAVLMDVSMPVMDGLTATRELKRERPELKIVILTGYGDERVAEEARAAGADAFFDKTTPLDRVADTLVELLEDG